jgi:predicted molibdopterin-dependent oxidoreductase YjgC
MTETAAMAHVVLPACSYAEKDGTFTNTEGLVQPVRQAIDPVGESRPDWEIVSALSVLMGYPIEYGSAKEIFKEIRSVIDGYALLGPTPTPPKPDLDAVKRYLEGGYAGDLAGRYRLAGERIGTRGEGSEAPGKERKRLRLLVGQTLFHSGKLSTKAKGLLQVQGAGALVLNPSDAETLGLHEGDRVRVFNSCGEATTTVRLGDRIPAGLAFFPEHFDEEMRRVLDIVVDPETNVPYYKTAHVNIERVAT